MQVLAPESARKGRVGLLVPRWTDPDRTDPQGTPFRTFMLGGALREAGYEVVWFDQELDLDRQDRSGELVAELASADAAFIWQNELYPSNQCHNAVALTARLKAALPDLPVVLGGEFLSICPPEFFAGFFDAPRSADFVLQGYGELSAVRLLEHLAAGTDPDDVDGLVRSGAAGALLHRPTARRQALRPEFLSFYRLLDMAPYVQTGGVFGNDQPTLTIAPGRGCTKGCGFCAWSTHAAKMLDAQVTYDVMAHLRERHGVRQFHIGELDFFVGRRRPLALAKLIAEQESDVVWFALGSPIDMVGYSDEDWDALYAGGLRKVELGSESGSPRTLRAIGKRHTPDDIVRITVKMLERGIVPMNNFLFGFPGETRADRLETVRVIDRLASLPYPHNHFTYRYYQPVWGTPLGEVAHAEIPDRPRRLADYLAGRPFFHAEHERSMHWLPEADEREVKQLINHDLPLATSQHAIEQPLRRRLYEGLRARAQRHVRAGEPVPRRERWLFDKLVARRLDQTYVA